MGPVAFFDSPAMLFTTLEYGASGLSDILSVFRARALKLIHSRFTYRSLRCFVRRAEDVFQLSPRLGDKVYASLGAGSLHLKICRAWNIRDADVRLIFLLAGNGLTTKGKNIKEVVWSVAACVIVFFGFFCFCGMWCRC